MFVNHKRCPNCGSSLKHYYWYCGECNNQEITNWSKTLIVWVSVLFIILIGLTFLRSNICSVQMFQSAPIC